MGIQWCSVFRMIIFILSAFKSLVFSKLVVKKKKKTGSGLQRPSSPASLSYNQDGLQLAGMEELRQWRALPLGRGQPGHCWILLCTAFCLSLHSGFLKHPSPCNSRIKAKPSLVARGISNSAGPKIMLLLLTMIKTVIRARIYSELTCTGLGILHILSQREMLTV